MARARFHIVIDGIIHPINCVKCGLPPTLVAYCHPLYYVLECCGVKVTNKKAVDCFREWALLNKNVSTGL